MYILLSKEPVIIYRRGGMGGGEGREKIVGGITWFLGEQKGGSVVTENPKGGITENFGRIQRGGPIKFSWKMKTWRGAGGREKHQKLFGGPDHVSEVTFKGEIG